MRSRHRQAHSRLRRSRPTAAEGAPPRTQAASAHAFAACASRSPGALAAQVVAACGSPPPGLASGRRRAFTLIEVLIAMFIAMIMTGVVMYLFSQTQRGTRVSLARAQLMLTATTVDARLRMDAASMVGPDRTVASAGFSPTAGGCLLVVPALRQGYVPLPNGRMSRNKVQLRSDQLVFMSKRDPNQPHPWVSMLPQPQNQAPSNTNVSPSSSWEARVWYGAVRDGNYAGGDGSANDASLYAHLWMVGRQAKLLVQGQKSGAMDCSVTTNDDTTAGSLVKPATGTSWPGLKDTALSAGWSDDDYVSNLAMPMSAAEQLDHAGAPTITPNIDLKQLQQGNAPSGVQLADIINSHVRLFENCSEIVVQWAGDLDKDGKIDTYPVNHPLAGAIIWYPEELHYTALKNSQTRPNLSSALQTKFDAIKNNDWDKAFPTGFAPWVQTRPNGRFGDLPASGAWRDRFLFEYGDTNNASPSPKVPKPYVFRFDDDQYRLVRYGYRQDGSNYKNIWDGKALPPVSNGPPVVASGTLHCFPYPPTAGVGMSDGFPTYYNNITAPKGPYPCAATSAGTDGNNFGDLMGKCALPSDGYLGGLQPAWLGTTAYALNALVSFQGVNYQATAPSTNIQPPNAVYWSVAAAQPTYKYRTAGNGIVGDPGRYGYLVMEINGAPTAPWPSNLWTVPTPELYLGAASAAGAETPWPYYSGGKLVVIRQVDGGTLASIPRPSCDTTADTVPLPSVVSQAVPMDQKFGPDNNFTATYTDIWAEYLKTINNPSKAGTREDWRMPQSDWPHLIRIRVRLHDPQGLVSSYSDEFLVNGRDDDGDGRVDNPEEGRMSGMWVEYVVSVPYPVDPSPRQH